MSTPIATLREQSKSPACSSISCHFMKLIATSHFAGAPCSARNPATTTSPSQDVRPLPTALFLQGAQLKHRFEATSEILLRPMTPDSRFVRRTSQIRD
ncbi:hypothetical protein SO694_0002102 [Aureococcus anophagefferens]|uniref:Uncharacterized protein n=1 Tax=Aureococcus anophagefferens TaxID=44056 RepID=A0ABR1FU83_AURAN